MASASEVISMVGVQESSDMSRVGARQAIRPRLVAVASGKGGVGKTMICLGIAWYLAKIGYRVVAADMDFGVGNLHLSAGLGRVDRSLDDFFRGAGSNIGDLAIPLPDNNRLAILAAGGRYSSATTVPDASLDDLLEKLSGMDADFVFLDVGAGTSQGSVGIFSGAHYQIGVTTGDLSAMAALTSLFRKSRVHAILNRVIRACPELSSMAGRDYASVSELFAHMDDQVNTQLILPIAEDAAKMFHPAVLVNRARDADIVQIQRINKNVAHSLNSADSVMGVIPDDEIVGDCRRRGQNFLKMAPACHAARALATITNKWHEMYVST